MANALIEVPFDARIELPFSWVCSTLLVDDVDRDDMLEILAGSRCGKLQVFKSGSDGHLWIQKVQCSDLITVLATGDLMNDGRWLIVCLSELGYCSVFRFVSTATSCALEFVFAQTLQANISTAYIGDVDGDSRNELMVGLTDRVVRTYRFTDSREGSGHLVAISKWETPGFIDCLSCCYPSSQGRLGALVYVSQPHGRYILLKPRHGSGQSKRDNHPSISYYACSMTGLVLSANATFVASFCTFDLKRVIFVQPNRSEVHLKLPHPPLTVNSTMASEHRLSGDQRPARQTRMFIIGTEVGRVYFSTASSSCPAPLVEANLHTRVRCFASAIGRFSPSMTRVHQCIVAVCNHNNRLLLYSIRSDKLLKSCQVNWQNIQ